MKEHFLQILYITIESFIYMHAIVRSVMSVHDLVWIDLELIFKPNRFKLVFQNQNQINYIEKSIQIKSKKISSIRFGLLDGAI